MSAELDYIWSRVQTALAAAVDEATYRIWLEPLHARELAHGRLLVQASPQSFAWVSKRFAQILGACVGTVLGPDTTVELIPAPGDAIKTGGPGELERFPPTPVSRSPLGNPKLTFDQFVIGDSNRLAHAAALAVAEMPAHSYNPLFICGPPGVGKTHLLSAIASLLSSHSPALGVRYTTGEAFTNEFLQALSAHHTDVFKAHFRDLDVLLVDDVQFLERKARTEEEFFHTFNAIYDSGRQLVLACDRPPRNLQALEDRLRERFASGLVADIEPPDLATRLTILRKRAAQDELTLSDETALELIATRIDNNVRALEGALIRVVAFSSLMGRPISPELTQEVLDRLYATASSVPHSATASSGSPSSSSTPSLADITAATCHHFDLAPAELLSSSRAARVAWPRQLAMYLARELTTNSLPAIGRHFGGRDHTTVLHAYRRAASRLATDPAARAAVDELQVKLSSPPPSSTSAIPDRRA